MNKFLSLSYYFERYPNPDFQYTKIVLAIGIILFLAGVGLSIYRKKYLKDAISKKILRKYPWKLEVFGALVLFFLFVREQGIPYLSMRIWWAILALFFLYTFIKLAITYKKDYKKRAGRLQRNSDFNKYLPKKKK